MLPIPAVGIDPGPQWATDVNSCLTIIDGHNHSPGYGVQIGTDGLNINSDLTINSNNLTNIRSSQYTSQAAVLTLPADLSCVYVVGADLYYNNGSGTPIRLTQNGSIAGTTGSISGLTGTASVSYVSGSSTFVFQSATNTPGNIDGASFILRNLVANSNGLTLSPPNAMASNYTITLPALPSSTSVLTMDTSGNITASSALYPSLQVASGQLSNVGLQAAVAANALTISLKQADGSSNPSVGSPVAIAMRSPTAGTGSSTLRLVTSGLTITVPTGATLGQVSAQNQYIFVYALDNSGTIELAVSGSRSFDEGSLQNTTAIGGGSTAQGILYSTVARTAVPVRYIGRLQSNQTVAGTYAAAISEVAVFTSFQVAQVAGESTVSGGNGFGSTFIRCFTTVRTSPSDGSVTYTSDAVNGDYWTINRPGVYDMTYRDYGGISGINFAITKNQPVLAVAPNAVGNASIVLDYVTSNATSTSGLCHAARRLQPGDVIRCSTGASQATTTDDGTIQFTITRLSD